jgi:hypothetical protein
MLQLQYQPTPFPLKRSSLASRRLPPLPMKTSSCTWPQGSLMRV